MALDNAVVIAQGKGGVGKTSLAANLAGLAAHQAGAENAVWLCGCCHSCLLFLCR